MEDETVKLILDALKTRWFMLAPTEDYPNTPGVTSELDRLEQEVKKWEPKQSKTE